MSGKKTLIFIVSALLALTLTAVFIGHYLDFSRVKETVWSARFSGEKTKDRITSFTIWLDQNPAIKFETVDALELGRLYDNLRNPMLPFGVANAKTVKCNGMEYRCSFSDGLTLECSAFARIYSDRTFLIVFYPEYEEYNEENPGDYPNIVIDLDNVLEKRSLSEFRAIFLKGREPSLWGK